MCGRWGWGGGWWGGRADCHLRAQQQGCVAKRDAEGEDADGEDRYETDRVVAAVVATDGVVRTQPAAIFAEVFAVENMESDR